jgi:hypothetical protein
VISGADDAGFGHHVELTANMDEDMGRYQPPLTLTPAMLTLIAEISEQIGRLSAGESRKQTPQLRRGNRIRTSEPRTDPVTDLVTDPVAKLLSTLGMSGPLKISDLMTRLGLTHKATFRTNYLRPALNAAFIEMTDPESPRSPAQKYRLTSRGKQIAAGLDLS